MSWHLAPSLVGYRQWIYAKYPKHDPKNDGAIGNEAHQAIKSDHNPNSRGSVNAIDTNENGIHMPTIIVAAMVHPSVNYIIYERVIYKSRNLFRGEVYRGENHHDEHDHTSIYQTVKAEQSKVAWGVTHWPTLMNGSVGRAVSELQGYLNVYGDMGQQLAVDGHFGDVTEARVRDYQRDYHVNGGVDGIVGEHTAYSLRTNGYHRH